MSGWLLCRGVGYTKRLGGMIHCCRAARLSQVVGNLWAPGLCPCTAILLGSMSHGGGIFRVDSFCALRRKSRESSHAIRKRLQSQAQYLPTPATLPYSALATHRRKPVSHNVYYRVAGFCNSFLPKLPSSWIKPGRRAIKELTLIVLSSLQGPKRRKRLAPNHLASNSWHWD